MIARKNPYARAKIPKVINVEDGSPTIRGPISPYLVSGMNVCNRTRRCLCSLGELRDMAHPYLCWIRRVCTPPPALHSKVHHCYSVTQANTALCPDEFVQYDESTWKHK